MDNLLTQQTMQYKPTSTPYYQHKTNPKKQVSFFGASPIPFDDYVVAHRHSVEITSPNGNVTYSNYFYGKVIQTAAECLAVCEKLNRKAVTPTSE
jgi:hypothetical protein